MRLVLQSIHWQKVFSPLVLVSILVAWLAFISVYGWGPAWQHDYPSYHLPFIVRGLNLSTWELWPNLLALWEGYPPLAHDVQGLLLWITGWPAIANAVNTIGLLLFIPAARAAAPDLDVRWVLIGFFAVPLFILNYPAGGVDIWFSLGVVVQFLALLSILSGDRRAYLHSIFIASAGFVMLSKMNGWAITPFLSIIYGFSQLKTLRSQPGVCLARFAVLAAVIGFWPLRNWIIMGSPTWPIPLPPLSTHGSFSISPMVHPEMFAGTPRPLMYVVSFFELTRFMTSEPMRWTFTMWHGSPSSPHQMMGGVNGAYMAALVAFFAYLIFRRKISKAAALIWISSAALASTLVQSYEMRYGIYIPMMLIAVLVREAPPNTLPILRTIMLVALAVVVSKVGFAGPRLFDPHKSLLSTYTVIPAFWESQAGKTSVQGHGYTCIPGADKYWSYTDPLGIYFTGPDLKSYNVKACREQCGLPWQKCGFEW
jgi:hypothetical protein